MATLVTQTQPIVQRARTMMNAIKLGLVAFVLFAGAYVFETKEILDLESSDNWTQVYAP